jgi:multiple sugar transport system ATP-binding protein
MQRRQACALGMLGPVDRAAAILDLKLSLDQYTRQLSYGQRQRVAMGRAIVRDSQVFMFDQPLSNHDANLRVNMRTEPRNLHKRLKATMVYDTDDQVEAMTMADKDCGGPYRAGWHSARVFWPARQHLCRELHQLAFPNLLPGTKRNGRVEMGKAILLLPPGASSAADGQPVTYSIRPEHLVLDDSGLPVRVWVAEPTDSGTLVIFKVAGRDLITLFREQHPFELGDELRLTPKPEAAHQFDAASGERI